jgi:hypothetical protein
MLIWIILIVGGALAFWGLRKGVFFMFISLFNLMVAIYVSTLGAPLIVKAAPDLETGYYAAFCMLLTAGLSFALLEGLGWYVFLRGEDILFPDLFDKIGGAVCGFLGGCMLLGLLVLAFCMMPISRRDFGKGFLPVEKLDAFGSKTTAQVCRLAAGLSLECLDGAEEKTLAYLIDLSKGTSEDLAADPQTDTNPVPTAAP